MNHYRKLLSLCFLGALAIHSIGVLAQTSGGVVRGSVYSGTIRGPRSNQAIAMKGIVVTVGSEKKAYMCYDTDLMRLSLAWTGDFLEFGNTLSQIAWPPPPQVRGIPAFGTKPGPGWAKDGVFTDTRPNNQGPLPKNWAHYEGFYVNGEQAVLRYNVGGVVVFESPGFENPNGQPIFTRTFQFETASGGQTLLVADGVEGTKLAADFTGDPGPAVVNLAGGKTLAVAGVGLPAGARLETTDDGRLVLKLSQAPANRPFRLLLSTDGQPAGFIALRETRPSDLRNLTKGGAARWAEPVVTKGVKGTEDGPYVVDTLTEPALNPWNIKTFFGGFDFFSDGRAAICTFHGDVYVVSGIDDGLEKLTWRRYANGLFQPLGLKVVNDTVYVLGRDQITRLHDLNKDGEADFYENFNNDTVVTSNYHEFSLDLHTDSAGNFYFAKGAPWEPDVTSPHQGCLIKVSKDGSKLEIIATGFRAPNGMSVGPRDEITVGDNQGHWMPSSKLSWIEKDGFYGMTPTAHRALVLRRGDTNFTANPSDPQVRAQYKFKGWDAGSPQPESYDKPIGWLPMNMDNSSGGQVWVTSDKWGPFKNHLLFMSYGKCTLFEVMIDTVEGVRQAAMVQFPLKFNSGLMRGRFNPADGQLYLSGLKGWQSSATRDGGFYRVRYTGGPVRMPDAFHAATNGIRITFASPLDPKTAADPANFSVERWDYRWTGAYGSPEYSVTNSGERKHDRLEVKAASLSSDGKIIWLELDEMKPSDQVKIKYSINAADGAPIAQEIYGTVTRLGPVVNRR
jgi:hypothetical protein